MIDSIKYAIISDIYVKDLICYSSENAERLNKFCVDNGISYVPGEDRKSCYRLINDNFRLQQLTKDLVCSPTDRLFDQKTIEKFERGSHDEVLFVQDNDRIIGVVHIVDYNNEMINIYFYKALYSFERMIRDLLSGQKETNQSLIDWMKEKGEKNPHWNLRYKQCVPDKQSKYQEEEQKRKDFGPFQTFYLNDLLYFAASKKYVSKDFRRNLNSIINIRNWVAHNKDLAHKSSDLRKPLYRIKELKEFVSNANGFIHSYEELEQKLDKFIS